MIQVLAAPRVWLLQNCVHEFLSSTVVFVVVVIVVVNIIVGGVVVVVVLHVDAGGGRGFKIPIARSLKKIIIYILNA